MSTAKPKTATSSNTSSRKPEARVEIISAGNLAAIPWLVHGFSTRRSGFTEAYGGRALNLGITKEDTREAVEHNREAFQKKLGSPGWPLVHMHQVHSTVIHHVKPAATGSSSAISGFRVHSSSSGLLTDIIGDHGQPLLTGDGLITSTPGLLLAVKTADCMPVLIVDPKKRVVGAFHAGWRGTLRRIVEKGVGEMRRCYGSKASDLQAVLGPSIRSCCYSVGEEVRDHFRSQFDYADELFREWQTYEDIHLKYPLLFLTMRAPGHSELPYRIFLDLAEANKRQLLSAGLRERNIEVLPGCTSCETGRFFSHRKESGVTGRMMAVVGIKQSPNEMPEGR
ncbi:MAG TPA: peptidoglycan editing factor PgeF [Terriglobales bacterium]|nr:peptidoglycan editing factor PgeF [Terriglobales bacterium]